MFISNLLDVFYSKEPDSKTMGRIDTSDFPYKTEQDFSSWLQTTLGLNYIEPERVVRRLAVAKFADNDEFKFVAGAEEYIENRAESALLGLETVTYELNHEGKALVGDMPMDIETDINAGSPQTVLLKSRVKRQLRNVGYSAEKTAKTQIALAELRKFGYLAPKFSQSIEIGVFMDEEKETMKVLGDVTKITYIIDLEDEKFIKALSKIMASQYVNEPATHLELVEA